MVTPVTLSLFLLAALERVINHYKLLVMAVPST